MEVEFFDELLHQALHQFSFLLERMGMKGDDCNELKLLMNEV
jgi:hypothetical protein